MKEETQAIVEIQKELEEILNFGSFWSYISEELKEEKKKKTFGREKSFSCYYDENYDAVVVKPESTRLPRDVIKSDFRRVWERFLEIREDPELEKEAFRPALYQRITRNASYILPLMKEYYDKVYLPKLKELEEIKKKLDEQGN